MIDRDQALAELRAAAGGIDPVLDQSDAYVRAVKQVQKTTRSQGQVMSQALANNFTLYHTNKKLVAENRELRTANASLGRANDELHKRLDALQATFAESGGDRYRALYEQSRRVLMAHLHEAMDPDEIRQRLEAMQAQAKELAALPEVITEAELQAAEVIPGPNSTPIPPESEW